MTVCVQRGNLLILCTAKDQFSLYNCFNAVSKSAYSFLNGNPTAGEATI